MSLLNYSLQSMTKTRTRTTLGQTAFGFTSGVPAGSTTMPGMTETITTVDHPGFKSRLGKIDVGGPFFLTRDRTVHSFPQKYAGTHRGSDYIIIPLNMWDHEPMSTSEMYSKGTTGIAQTVPTSPAFNAITFYREMEADGVPSVPVVSSWKQRTKSAKDAGGEFLNVQFGWLPLVSEMRNFAKAVKNHNQILHDLRKGSSHLTRAGYQFPTSTITRTDTRTAQLQKGGSTGSSEAVPNSQYYGIKTSNTWFKGAFRYHLPASDSQLSKAALYATYADKLLGVKPTPEAIWNSSPWTWALDWFSNAGDVMTNISQLNQNGVVLMYGYVMSSLETREIISTPKYTSDLINAGSRTRIRESKKRLPASPYGFGVSYDGLSSTQQAIIAALGLTKFGGGRG